MILVILLLLYLLLVIAFLIDEKTVGFIASFGIMSFGVYLLSSGWGYLDNLLVSSIGIISIGLGAYIIIAGSIESIEYSTSG